MAAPITAGDASSSIVTEAWPTSGGPHASASGTDCVGGDAHGAHARQGVSTAAGGRRRADHLAQRLEVTTFARYGRAARSSGCRYASAAFFAQLAASVSALSTAIVASSTQ